MGPALNNQDFLAAADRSFIYDNIVRGRPGTAMPAWGHMPPEDLTDLVTFIDSWRKEPRKPSVKRVLAGDVDYGLILYGNFCASCHGREGEGGVGPQLRNPIFLDIASDAFLQTTIEGGRRGTAMRPFGQGEESLVKLSSFQVDSIITYLRSWEDKGGQMPQRFVFGFPQRGRVLYKHSCSQCHGEVGQGKTGPAHNNADFLATASDGYLQATMVLGRAGTEMRAVAKGHQGNIQLSVEEINDIVAYIRAWETFPTPPEELRRFLPMGDFEKGRELYMGVCASCHGTDGKGDQGPSLNNTSFLRAVSDGFLQAIIVRGRQSTPMTPFGLGSHGIAQLSVKEINDIIYFIRHWEDQTRTGSKVAAGSSSDTSTE
jgi:mono/diheme cytochrome c family protein